MSIVERVSGARGGGWLISHESFLEEVYSTPPLCLKPLSGIFDVRTPFRMDAEAAKVAAASDNLELEDKSAKRNRGKAWRGEKSTEIAQEVGHRLRKAPFCVKAAGALDHAT